jgi:hypothetical protein
VRQLWRDVASMNSMAASLAAVMNQRAALRRRLEVRQIREYMSALWLPTLRGESLLT